MGLVLTAALPRLLRAEDLATYWLAVSALSLVVLLAQSGVGQVAISRISQALATDRKEAAQDYGLNSLAVVAVFALGVSLAVAVAIRQLWVDPARDIGDGALLFVVAGGVLCALYVQAVDLLRAQQGLLSAVWLASQPASGGVLTTAIFVAGLWVASPADGLELLDVATVFVLFLVSWGLPMVAAIWLLSRGQRLRIFSARLNSDTVVSMGASAAPVVASAVTMFVITQADLWAIAHYRGPGDTAIYGTAGAIVKYVSAINLLFAALLPGFIGELYARSDIVTLQNVLRRTARLGIVAGLIVFTAFACFGGVLIEYGIGVAYREALKPLLVLSIGHLVNAFLGYSSAVLVTADRTRALVFASFLASVVTLVLLASLTPSFGMTGAAIAATVGMGTYNIATWMYCGTRLGVWCHATAREAGLGRR
jgi:O-antigen/teichoic acid export membrane protein